MIEIYLFDWGNTLMVDFPDASGKMCDWDVVETISGAEEALQALSQQTQIYIATGAAESTEAEIKTAFQRVGIAKYISGYFCKANLGLAKGTPDFLNAIMKSLNKPAINIAMVGDNFEKDIKPALLVGIHPIWLTANKNESVPEEVRTITKLSELHN